MLEKEVAGDGGTEVLETETEEVLDVEIPRAFSVSSSRIGNEKSLKEVLRDRRLNSSSRTKSDCIFEPSGILGSLSRSPKLLSFIR